jgi:hypothetical protein
MPPTGNPSVVPRDHSYTNAHSDRQCEFTFQLVNPGTARTRVSAYFFGAHAGAAKPRYCPILVTTTVLARETRGYPGFRVQMGGHGGPPLLRHLVGTGVPAGPFPGFLDAPE